MVSAGEHAHVAQGPGELDGVAADSSHRRSMRPFVRLPAFAIFSTVLLQATTVGAFASGNLPRLALDVNGPRSGAARGVRPSLHRSPMCTISADPERLQTMVRSAGRTVVMQFRDLRELGIKTTGFLRRGQRAPHQQALRSTTELSAWLEEDAGCDLSLWGVGKAKEPEHLLKELRKGESFLRPDGTRALKVAKVRVFDGDYELVEVSQILGAKLTDDGIVSGGILKERHGRHLAEKFMPGETPIQACGRGIAEELEQIVGKNPAIHVLNQDGRVSAWEEEDKSTSYPGLASVYQLYFLECEVEGLNRAATGMTFYTGENCDLDGHCDKVHVWEWRKREPGPTVAPAGCRTIDATLWKS